MRTTIGPKFSYHSLMGISEEIPVMLGPFLTYRMELIDCVVLNHQVHYTVIVKYILLHPQVQ